VHGQIAMFYHIVMDLCSPVHEQLVFLGLCSGKGPAGYLYLGLAWMSVRSREVK